jgi:hypothetical protein
MENDFLRQGRPPATIHKLKDAYFNKMMMLPGASCFLSYQLAAIEGYVTNYAVSA